MGQAIIFKGVTVTNPLQTVNFILETAQDYVSAYFAYAPSAVAKELELNTFVQTLISNGIWAKTAHCYPILGGLNEYYYDLKAVNEQDLYGAWRTPSVGTTWDATRNSINLSLPGLAYEGIPMQFSTLSRTSSCFIASFKNQRVNEIAAKSKYSGSETSYLSAIFLKSGGYRSPAWSTTLLNANLVGYDYSINNNYIFISNFNAGNTALKIAQNAATFIDGGTGVTNSNTVATFAFGSSYAAAQAAPAQYTFNGNFNFFIAFNSFLTDAEMSIVSQAIYNFNQSLGRHTNF